MKAKDLSLLLFIVIILVLCVGLRLTTNIEPTNLLDDNKLVEVEVERVNPDITKTKTKKVSKKKKNTKQVVQTNEDNTVTVFEPITSEDYKTDNAVVKIVQEEIEMVEPLPDNLFDWENVDISSFDYTNIDINIKDEIDLK